MKKEIDINIVKCEGVEIVKTVVENKNVKIVITRNDFSRYLHERYGKSDENENENKNIRLHDENEEEVGHVLEEVEHVHWLRNVTL